MKVTYYSEKLNKYFDKKEDCVNAEIKHDNEIRKIRERKEAQTKAQTELLEEKQKVVDAYEYARKLEDIYNNKVAEFNKKYGSNKTNKYQLPIYYDNIIDAINLLSRRDIF